MDKGSDAACNRKQRAIEKKAVSLHTPVGSAGYTVTLKKERKKKSRRKKMS